MDPPLIDSANERSVEVIGTELIKKRREALRTVCRRQMCSSGLCQPVIVLQGGESGRRSTVIVVSPLTSLMMEQREMEQRDQFTTHEVCRRATTGSRYNGKRQGRKMCTA